MNRVDVERAVGVDDAALKKNGFETVIYEEVNVQEMALSPEVFKGRKVAVSGKVGKVEESKSGHLVHLEIPVPDGYPGETQAVAAEFEGDVSSLASGLQITVKGTSDDIHIIAVPDRCGIVVVPLIKAESLEIQ